MKNRHMALTQPTDWISYPLLATNGSYRRQLLIISGEADWCRAQGSAITASLPGQLKCCWVGEYQPQQALTYRSYAHYRDLLGEEFEVAVIDAGSAFRPSVMAAITGTVRQGGTAILLCPDLLDWATHDSVLTPHFLSYGATITKSFYIDYVAKILCKADFAGVISLSGMRLPKPERVISSVSDLDVKLTGNQEKVFNSVISEQKTSEASCIVAGRGRGKSTLTGFIAAHFLSNGHRVMLTAPSAQSVKTLESTANHLIKDVPASLTWMALDNPQLKETEYDVLIIDEAASVPLPVLNQLVSAAPFTLLSTTTDGYEGSGHGFRTKFLSQRDIPVHTLTEALRWSDDDPLEQLIGKITFTSRPDTRIRKQTHEQLSNPAPGLTTHLQQSTFHQSLTVPDIEESLLVEVMGLLSAAHYQSSPDDMARLIDAPQTEFHLLKYNGNLVAACAVEAEGGPGLTDVSSGIASGNRRVRGHLTAQSFAHLAANPVVATLMYKRINRIAVKPELQGNAFGSRLLSETVRHYQNTQQADLITSSFGADSKLLNFWTRAGFTVIKRGRKPDKSSGLTSAMVAMPLSRCAKDHLRHTIECETGPHSEIARQLHLTRLQQFAEGYRSVDHLYSSSSWLRGNCDDETLIHCLQLLEERMNPAEVACMKGYEGKKVMVTDCRQRVAGWLASL